MKYITFNYISPNFGPEKLESPTYVDLVDVFEDRMRNWFLMPAECLLELPHCQIAAVGLLISYFEGIAIYLSGNDSKNKSFEFFERGFCVVFPINHINKELPKIVAHAIYEQARCGFAHDGMFRYKVLFNDLHANPISITFPENNGILDTGQIKSIVINPKLFFESISNHFDDYLKRLRSEIDAVVKQNFEATVKLKWALDEGPLEIGMDEEEFYEP